MRITAPLLFIIWLAGCGSSGEGESIAFGPGLADFSAKIAGDYYIHRASAHHIVIAPRLWSDETPIIPAKVVECDFDWDFIIARQQELRRKYPDNPRNNYMEPAPGKHHYWILDVRTPKVYGPFTLERFILQRKALGVSEMLTLKDVYSFRP